MTFFGWGLNRNWRIVPSRDTVCKERRDRERETEKGELGEGKREGIEGEGACNQKWSNSVVEMLQCYNTVQP
jgi:hypothetical protein